MVEPITIATQALNIGKATAVNPGHNAALVTGDVSAAGRLGASAVQTLSSSTATERNQSSTSGQKTKSPLERSLDRTRKWLTNTNATKPSSEQFSSAKTRKFSVTGKPSVSGAAGQIETQNLGSRPWEGGSVSSIRGSNFANALSPDRLEATRIKPPESPNLKASLGQRLDRVA